MNTSLPLVFLGAALSITLLATETGMGQAAPFSMDPERLNDTERASRQPVAPQLPGSPAALPAASSPRPGGGDGVRRFLIPDSQLQLTGETARRAWSVVLTANQAASPASLNLGYQNSVFVAPEFSRLQVAINGEQVLQTPISSPDTVGRTSISIPPSILRAGRNIFEIRADQRHRTDCSIDSTFELWTEVAPEGTFLSFESETADQFSVVEDLAAIGNDAAGQTRINIVAPQIGEKAYRDLLVELAQNIALITNMPRQSVTVRANPPEESDAILTIYFGQNEQLLPIAGLEPYLGQPGFTGFVDIARAPGRSFLVSGTSLPDIEQSVRAIAAVAEQMRGEIAPDVLDTQNALAPLPPLVGSAGVFEFNDLGLTTREFSGRLFQADLAFALPEDFYATAYGHFEIRLDAAYAPSVLPGSGISIYVNGNIASNIPLNQAGGSIMNKHPVSVPLRNARPGLNTITIEGRFNTAEDEICAPGTTGDTDQRFVLFDTSQIVFPQLARIGRIPDLASFAGFGFPYSSKPATTKIVLADRDEDTLSAATTLASSLAVFAGRALPFETANMVPISSNQSAIFIGNVADFPREVLGYVGLGGLSDTEWADAGDAPLEAANAVRSNEETLQEWRTRLAGEGMRGRIMRFLHNLQTSLNLSDHRLVPQSSVQGDYSPPAGTDLLVAQNATSELPGAWTILTAPNGQNIARSMEAYLRYANRLNGSISAIQSPVGQVSSVQHGHTNFVITEPLSFSNIRLVVTNWLSINALVFCALVLLVVVLFGLSADGMLKVFGRRS